MQCHRRLLKSLLATGAAFALVPAAAQATITHTNVTSAGTPFGFANENLSSAPTNTRTVTGTSDGTSGVDQVDIRCEAPSVDILLASGVTVGSGGAFTTTIHTTDLTAGPRSAHGVLCRIVAVPTGQDPTDLTNFTGPVIGNGELNNNDGSPGSYTFDYLISQPQSKAYNDYLALGGCGLCDSALYGPKLTQGQWLWYDNAAIYSNTYSSGGVAYPYAEVGGVDVYSPADATRSLPGAPALTYTHKINRNTGDLTITEVDPLVKCSPSPSSCTSYVSAGLAFHRTIVQSNNGRLVRITDVIRSTDGKAHSFTFAYDEFQDGPVNGFRFPGDRGYEEQVDGNTGALSSAPIQTIYVIADKTNAPGIGNPVGALTVSPAPAVARFGPGASNGAYPSEGFDLVFRGRVPAGGSKTIKQYFAMAPTQAEVDRYASANQAAMK